MAGAAFYLHRGSLHRLFPDLRGSRRADFKYTSQCVVRPHPPTSARTPAFDAVARYLVIL